ncbi:unnamed protein product [Prorocentrum cordatum]|uniref:Uncharacterized protein n=1 Tax=Prorocentrum cordatum TaxID=2364126 RepID=A0ABN9SHC6_9DINO|nr:unnamed protein product [Polarella glacialis]
MKGLRDITVDASIEQQKGTTMLGQYETDAITARVVQLKKKNGKMMHVRACMCKRGDHTQTILYMLPTLYSVPSGPKRPESKPETEPLSSRHTGSDHFI